VRTRDAPRRTGSFWYSVATTGVYWALRRFDARHCTQLGFSLARDAERPAFVPASAQDERRSDERQHASWSLTLPCIETRRRHLRSATWSRPRDDDRFISTRGQVDRRRDAETVAKAQRHQRVRQRVRKAAPLTMRLRCRLQTKGSALLENPPPSRHEPAQFSGRRERAHPLCSWRRFAGPKIMVATSERGICRDCRR